MTTTELFPVTVIIEIEKYSNMKWEYDRIKDELFLDRILNYPYFYPYAYGFIPYTLGNDGDELDILLITDKKYPNYNTERTSSIDGCIVGGLMMHDEKGADEKIFVVPIDEIDEYNCKSASEIQQMEENIVWFFSNYKSKDTDKWSRVEQLLTKEEAILTYKHSYSKWLKTINL